ncbi:MAG: SCO family protein [Halioglobus sp.]
MALRWSARTRILIGFLIANAAIATVAMLVLLNRPDSPPIIQGVLLPDGRELPVFSLFDHHNQPFTNEDLKGRWHLVSYGFTTCPDICPTTLSQLALVASRLEQQGGENLRFLFYSVDHRRDTVNQMATYMPFFHPRFIGLTHKDDANNPHLPFEQGLGIAAQLVPNTEPGTGSDANEYQVIHGVTLMLVNPEGKLQAIFKPDQNLPGTHTFEAEKILRDYLAIRQYLG